MDTSTLPKVFLDLEDTVIDTWGSNHLVNRAVVTDWLKELNVTEVRIFSFAIWDEKDKETFVTSGLKEMLEQAHGVTIVEWLSVDEMVKLSKEFSGVQWEDRLDFMQLRGKHGAFFDVCKVREQGCTCILLDDAIPHETLLVHHRDLTINLHPVQLLTGHQWKNWAP